MKRLLIPFVVFVSLIIAACAAANPEELPVENEELSC